jgi:hypothetical protein
MCDGHHKKILLLATLYPSLLAGSPPWRRTGKQKWRPEV